MAGAGVWTVGDLVNVLSALALVRPSRGYHLGLAAVAVALGVKRAQEHECTILSGASIRR